mgnify:CR=1 FL=1
MDNLNPDYLPEGKMRHGGPYDRGGADYYYLRPNKPHYYLGSTGMPSEQIRQSKMSEKQIAEYNEGWEDQKKSGVKRQ